MSASAEIFRFPGRTAGSNSGFWGNQDIADVYRCLDLFTRHGLSVEAASGLSDEGDPWFAIEDTATGDALIHIARIDGFFIVHVLDGETWSGDTLRSALANIDVQALTGFDAPAHHDGAAADGDDDKDGTHAFLRIVSAVVAVLTADVIANAVTHEAAASPLPPSGAPDAGDHVFDATKLALDLPTVESSLPEQHRADAAAMPTEDQVKANAVTVKIDKVTVETVPEHATAVTPAPAENIEISALIAVLSTDGILDTSAKQAVIISAGQSQGVALSYAVGSEHVQVAYQDKVTFVGADDKSDMFLIVLNGQDRTLTTKVENFDKGHDSLVIEKSDDDSTSSAIVTDLGALVASNGSHLTVVGQATVEIHLAAQTGSTVAGG